MSDRRTGIDQRGSGLFAVSLRDEAGRVVVDRLEANLGSLDDRRDLVQDGAVGIAVPDHLVMVKRIQLEDSFAGSLPDRLHFELAQSLLESENEFHFDYLTVDGENRYLGMIVRRERIAEVVDRHNLGSLHADHKLSFQPRAVALGKGYLAFCSSQDNDLTALVDLAGTAASVCFIYHHRIVDIATLPSGYDLSCGNGRERFAVELKTLVNYRLSRLFEMGVSVPLGRLLLSGDAADDELFLTAQNYFPLAVDRPRLLEGYFSGGAEPSRETLPLYLVALGLTVN
jgi:hypothetical protein